MIQRLQSLFLILAVIANLLLFNFDIWTAQATNDQGKVVEKVRLNALELYYNPSLEGQVTQSNSVIWLTLLTSVVAAVALISVFLFKSRMLQIKVSRFGMLLEAGLIALMFYYVDNAQQYFVNELSSSNYEIGVFLPMAGVVFFFLANMFILKDERLVRSSERLR